MEGLDIVEAVAIVRSRGVPITIDDILDEVQRGTLKAEHIDGEYFFKIGNFVDWFSTKVVKKAKSL